MRVNGFDNSSARPNEYVLWRTLKRLNITAGSSVWGAITGNILNQTDLINYINSKIPATGVFSVTGNIVNNADPTNPVVTQQQADWTETNNANIDYIKNKPNVVLFGTTAPNNSLGIDGDGYMVVDEADNVNPLLGNFYKKVAGSWTVVVNFATN